MPALAAGARWRNRTGTALSFWLSVSQVGFVAAGDGLVEFPDRLPADAGALRNFLAEGDGHFVRPGCRIPQVAAQESLGAMEVAFRDAHANDQQRLVAACWHLCAKGRIVEQFRLALDPHGFAGAGNPEY